MRMKNKKKEQKRKKEKHPEEIKKAKRRKRGALSNLERPRPEREEKKKILIVCEGKVAEPSYFNKFKLSTATIKSVGEGDNTLSLIGKAQHLSRGEDYDQVWCVFDKDDFPDINFNNAVYKARKMGLKVAYSNQAFEYWLILHFENHQGGALHRKQYCKKLKKYFSSFNISFDCKKKEISDEIYEILVSKTDNGITRQELAISRARKIMEKHGGKNPAKEESSTTDFKLVEELEKYR